MSAATAGEVTVQAVKNLHSRFAVDGAEIGAGLGRPMNCDAIGPRRFGHFFRPNSRRISS